MYWTLAWLLLSYVLNRIIFAIIRKRTEKPVSAPMDPYLREAWKEVASWGIGDPLPEENEALGKFIDIERIAAKAIPVQFGTVRLGSPIHYAKPVETGYLKQSVIQRSAMTREGNVYREIILNIDSHITDEHLETDDDGEEEGSA